MESLLAPLLPRLRLPSGQSRIWKSECAFCFDTAESSGGLYTNLASLSSVGAGFLALDRARSGGAGAVYLHTRSRRVARVPAAAPPPEAPVRLAVVAEEPTFDLVSEFAVVAFGPAGEEQRVAYPAGAASLPSLLVAIVDAVIAVRDTGVSEAAAATWEDLPQPSKYADALVQEDSGLRISSSPADWVCGSCDKRDNLWLNLGDGYIGCGRRNFDGR